MEAEVQRKSFDNTFDPASSFDQRKFKNSFTPNIDQNSKQRRFSENYQNNNKNNLGSNDLNINDQKEVKKQRGKKKYFKNSHGNEPKDKDN